MAIVFSLFSLIHGGHDNSIQSSSASLSARFLRKRQNGRPVCCPAQKNEHFFVVFEVKQNRKTDMIIGHSLPVVRRVCVRECVFDTWRLTPYPLHLKGSIRNQLRKERKARYQMKTEKVLNLFFPLRPLDPRSETKCTALHLTQVWSNQFSFIKNHFFFSFLLSLLSAMISFYNWYYPQCYNYVLIYPFFFSNYINKICPCVCQCVWLCVNVEIFPSRKFQPLLHWKRGRACSKDVENVFFFFPPKPEDVFWFPPR